MPVVIFEGASGTGKTTAAMELSRETGWPIYRAFRGSPNEHTPGESYRYMSLIPIETNTWRPDLAVADFLSQAKGANVIMDRTLISGLAHDPSMWYGTPPFMYGDSEWRSWQIEHRCGVTHLNDSGLATLELWSLMMARVQTLLVLTRSTEAIRVARGGRNGAWEDTAIMHVVSKIPKSTMRVIDCMNQETSGVIGTVKGELDKMLVQSVVKLGDDVRVPCRL